MKKIVISLIILCLWGLLLPEDGDLPLTRITSISGQRGDTWRYFSSTEELPDGVHKATYRILPLTLYYSLVEADLLDDIMITTLDLTFELNTEHPEFETGQEIGIDLLKPWIIEDLFTFSLIVNSKTYKGGYVIGEGEFVLNEQQNYKSVTLKQFWTYPMRPQRVFYFRVKYKDYPLGTASGAYTLPSNLEILEEKDRDEEKLEFRLKGN